MDYYGYFTFLPTIVLVLNTNRKLFQLQKTP